MTTTTPSNTTAALSASQLRQKNLDEVVMSPWQNPLNDPLYDFEADEASKVLEDCCTFPSSAPDRKLDEFGSPINTLGLGEGFEPEKKAPIFKEDWVLPRLDDEFTCQSCFLHARNHRLSSVPGVCKDCAGES